MAKDYVQKITIDASMQVDGVRKGIADIQNSFKNLKLDSNATKGVSESIAKLEASLKKFEEVASHDIKNSSDNKAFQKSWAEVSRYIDEVNLKLKKLGLDPKKLIPNENLKKLNELKTKILELQESQNAKKAKRDTLKENYENAAAALDQLKARQAELNKTLESSSNRNELAETYEQAKIKAEELKEIRDELNKKSSGSSAEERAKAQINYEQAADQAKKAHDALKDYDKGLETTKKELEEVNAAIANSNVDQLEKEWKEAAKAVGSANLKEVKAELQELTTVDLSKLNMRQLLELIDQIAADETNKLSPATQKAADTLRLLIEGMESGQQAGDKLASGINDASESSEDFNKQVQALSNQMTQFFSLTSGWNLLKRSISSAVDVVKELDEAMTGIAVVSEYDLSDIWGMRSDFSQQATQLGVSTLDLVNATTLYVQQGLNLNDAMQVAVETMKMGRIAGLDGADATEKMTAALRGYNMELTEAQHVNDVYSNLAAKSASNQEQLATAMSKTASIAYNSGASFENMSAFLAQIIETTQEAPETAGTAMKTIIARFQELKKPLEEIGEVEGEVVDANKIETALKSAGVALRDANGQFRDFDDVILELSSKWDKLDKMTQRYIATTAAGSRQQSRFIALLDNNERLLELTGYATNSAGKSQEQFNKTLESFESKIAKLRNELDIFYTNLANNRVVKDLVDLITNLIHGFNQLIEPLANSENILANLSGALIEIGVIAIGFRLALMAIKGAADKATGSVVGLAAAIEAESKSATVGSIGTLKLAASFSVLKKNIMFFPQLLKQLILGFRGVTAAEAQDAAAKATAAAGNEALAAAQGKAAASAYALGTALKAAFPYLLLAGAAVAAFVLIKNSLEADAKAAEKSAEKLKELQEAADEASTQLEEMKQLSSDYSTGVESLKELDKTTSEYADTLEKTNEQAKELINTLGLASAYTIDENGIIQIDENALADAQKRLQDNYYQTLQDQYNGEIDNILKQQQARKTDLIQKSQTSSYVKNDLDPIMGYDTEALYNFYEINQENIDKMLQSMVNHMSDADYEVDESLVNKILADVFGDSATDFEKKYIEDHLDALRELADGEKNAADMIEYYVSEKLRSKIQKETENEAQRIATNSEGETDIGLQYNIEGALHTLISNSSLFAVTVKDLEVGSEEYLAAIENADFSRLERIYTNAIESILNNKNVQQYDGLAEAIINGLANGKLDFSSLMLNEEAIIKLQDEDLLQLLGPEGISALEDAGISMTDLANAINGIDYQEIVSAIKQFAGENNKTAVQAIEDLQTGKFTSLEDYNNADAYKELLIYLNQVSDTYGDITDEVSILNKEWLIGTEEYTQALEIAQNYLAKMNISQLQDNVQKAKDAIDDYLKKNPGELKLEVPSKEYKALQDDLDKAEFEVKVAIKAEGRQNISELTNDINHFADAFDVINENLQVTASDFLDLVDVFPELAEGIEVLDDGMIQLSEDSVKAAQEAGQGQIDAMADAKIAELEMQQAAAQATVNYYKALVDAADKAAEAEVNTEEDKTQAINNLEHLLAQAVVNYANETNEGVTEQAENTATNIGEASAAAGNTAMTNGQRMATNVIDNLDAIAEEGDLSAGAVAEAHGEAAGITNTAWYQAASNAVAYLNRLAQAVNKVAKKSFTYDEKEGLVEHPSSLTPLPTDSSVDYQSVDKAYANRHQKGKASVTGPEMLSGEVDLSTTSAAKIAKQLLDSEAFRNQFKADAASRLADAQATLADINAQIATIEGLRKQANKKLADKTKNTGSGGSGSSGGGGGSGKDAEKWVQNYDWLYNLLQEINKLERNVNKLQKERNRLINNNKNDAKKMLEMAKEEERLLQKQLADQQLLQVKRLEELNAIEDQYSKYKAENGKTYDFTKYASYDPNLGYTVIDYDTISQLDWTEDIGKAFEGYVSYLENIQKDLEGIEDQIGDLQDAVVENQKLGRDEYIQFEQDTIKALETLRQEEIDELQSVYNAINNGNQATIDALNAGIEEYRNQREQDDALKDIGQQERKLALMMTDTSQANQLDILNAQKSLDDARQNYTDSLIDKAIDNMSKQAEEAQKQRELQIQLMEEQLKYDLKNGIIAKEAQELLDACFNRGDSSLLLQLFGKVDGIKSMGFATKEQWTETLKNSFEQAYTYANRNGLTYTSRVAKEEAEKQEAAKKAQKQEEAREEARKTAARKQDAIDQDKARQSTKEAALAGATTVPEAIDALNRTTKLSNTDPYKDTFASGKGAELRLKTGQKTAAMYPDLNRPSGVSVEAEDTYRGIAEFIAQYPSQAGWGNRGDIPALTKKLSEKLGDGGALRVLQIIESIYNKKAGSLPTHYAGDVKWMSERYGYSAFATGGLADFTGPAWLDGTKSKPEYVLNAEQTEKFFDLLDFTRDIGTTDNSTLIGDTYYNISMSNEIASDYDVDSMWDEMQRKIYENAGYRNVQSLDFGRR